MASSRSNPPLRILAMNVNILTYHFVENHGAALQAYCLRKVIEDLGHHVRIIDYCPRHLTDGGPFWWSLDRWHRRANLVIAYKRYIHYREMLFGNGGKRGKFEAFHRDFLKLQGRRYHTLRELVEDPPAGDVVICGSDQIWNSSEQFGIDPAYFLGFAPPGQRTASYAASFGRPELDKRYHAKVGELLAHVGSISVREKSGVDIVSNLTGREAAWVLDPTFLVDPGHLESIATVQRTDPYIFSYTLRSRELVAEIEAFSTTALDLPVVSPATLREAGRPAPGPLEWLGHIKGAKFVITNSFHGTVFSILFSKPFIFVGLQGVKSSFNERARSLLKRLGLADRMIASSDPTAICRLLSEPPDWELAHAALEPWRAESLDYLESAIQGEPEKQHV